MDGKVRGLSYTVTRVVSFTEHQNTRRRQSLSKTNNIFFNSLPFMPLLGNNLDFHPVVESEEAVRDTSRNLMARMTSQKDGIETIQEYKG
jgi:hypothetical protein